jgi:hypothetical protein
MLLTGRCGSGLVWVPAEKQLPADWLPTQSPDIYRDTRMWEQRPWTPEGVSLLLPCTLSTYSLWFIAGVCPLGSKLCAFERTIFPCRTHGSRVRQEKCSMCEICRFIKIIKGRKTISNREWVEAMELGNCLLPGQRTVGLNTLHGHTICRRLQRSGLSFVSNYEWLSLDIDSL